MNQKSDFEKSPFVRVGVALIAYWVFAVVLGFWLEMRQPDQLGVMEAYVYHTFVAYPLAWVFLLGAAVMGGIDSGSHWPRVIGRSITIVFLASFVIGLLIGSLRIGYGFWDIPYNTFYTSFFSPPPELLILGLVLWAVREV